MPAGRPKKQSAGGQPWYTHEESHAQTVAQLRAEFNAMSPRKRAEKLADVRRALSTTKRPGSALVELAREVYEIEP